ncbi:MAG: MGMT family protein [Bacteroidetes bacterium]|nr:MGMT family protein [Bacteroidota bacterium]
MSKKDKSSLSAKLDFFERVYAVVREIPPGRVTSYGMIGEFLGAKSSARMVGYAMNAVGDRIDIPAHRVVNRSGLLTGKFHFETQNTMKERLLSEEIEFIQEDQVNMEKHCWIPSDELPAAFRLALVR